MKKLFISLLFSLFFIVGCLDYTHYITKDDSNNITVVAAATISKSVIESIAYSEGYNDGVPDAFYKEMLFKLRKKCEISYPRNFKFRDINNETDIGLYINGVINADNLNDAYCYLIPIKTDNKFVFSPYDYSDELEDYKKYSKIFKSMKIKLMVSKNYIPNITSCYITSSNGTKDVNVYDLKDSFLIEVPMFNDMESTTLYIEP